MLRSGPEIASNSHPSESGSSTTLEEREAVLDDARGSPWNGRTQGLRWIYTIGGGVGLVSAFVLLVEKIALLKDASYVPTCSINPILSCGSIMKTDQSELFGFPNPMLGIVGFTVVLTVGAALFAGATFRPWFWLSLLAGTAAGLSFVLWLIFQSLYRIDALCPYCMVVWAVTIAIFWYTTLHCIESWIRSHGGEVGRVFRFVGEYRSTLLVFVYLCISVLIGQRFWDYWSTLLS